MALNSKCMFSNIMELSISWLLQFLTFCICIILLDTYCTILSHSQLAYSFHFLYQLAYTRIIRWLSCVHTNQLTFITIMHFYPVTYISSEQYYVVARNNPIHKDLYNNLDVPNTVINHNAQYSQIYEK